MKKYIFHLAIAFTAIFGGILASACSDNVDELVLQLIEANKSKDYEKAQKIAEKACKKGSDYGCYHAGGLLGVKKEFKKAMAYHEKGCNMNTKQWSGRCCSELGAIYLESLDFAERDTAKAMELFEKGCELGYGYACYSAAAKYKLGLSAPVDESKFLEYVRKACDLGERLGCLQYNMHTRLMKKKD